MQTDRTLLTINHLVKHAVVQGITLESHSLESTAQVLIP